MTPLNFPQSPTVGQNYSSGSKTWQWNGTYWIVLNSEIQNVGIQGYQGPQGLNSTSSDAYSLQNINPFFPRTITVNNITGLLFFENENNNKITIGSTTLTESGYITGSVGNTSVVIRAKQNWGSKTSLSYTNYGIAYGAGKWVTTGETGQICYSTNGSSWGSLSSTSTKFLSTDRIYAISYENNIFLAGGTGGRISTSTDGITWTAVTTNLTADVQSITYGNGIYLATGSGFVISTSTDAITWTTRTVTASGTTGLSKATFGSGVFAATNGGIAIATSTDTVTWTTRASNLISSDSMTQLKYLNAGFVGIGANTKIITSTNGLVWTQIGTLSISANNIDYSSSGTYYLCNTSDIIQASTNLTTWYSYGVTDLDERAAEKLWVAISAKNNKLVLISSYYLASACDELINSSMRLYYEGTVA